MFCGFSLLELMSSVATRGAVWTCNIESIVTEPFYHFIVGMEVAAVGHFVQSVLFVKCFDIRGLLMYSMLWRHWGITSLTWWTFWYELFNYSTKYKMFLFLRRLSKISRICSGSCSQSKQVIFKGDNEVTSLVKVFLYYFLPKETLSLFIWIF